MIIPFFIPHAGCPHQCVFCNQKRITGQAEALDPASITATIESFLRSSSWKQRRTTSSGEQPRRTQVAFYGGSFTALPPEKQRAYLEKVLPFIASGAVRSIRISTRPDGITPPILALLREHQVTTVELGVQSFDNEVLRQAGRGHTAEDSVAAAHILRKYGFELGFQLMPGLPGDSLDRFRAGISRTCELGPDFVRIYPAVVIRDTPLERLARTGAYVPLALEDAVAWCTEAHDILETAGIKVVRMGLQRTEELGKPGTIVSGPYHPAFGQLVASAGFLKKMLRAISGGETGMNVLLLVHPAELSTAIGQKRKNLRTLQQQMGSSTISVQADPRVQRGTVRLQQTA